MDAVGTTPAPKHRTQLAATTGPRWTVPHDQVSAPVAPSGGGSGGSLLGVSCVNAKVCVAVGSDGANGVAATTNDGGATWTQGALDANEPVLDAVDCFSTSQCVAVGQGASATSSDGGATWTSSSLPTKNTTLLGVDCPTSSLCVSAGISPGNDGPYAGQLLVSSDGGATWTVPQRPRRAWSNWLGQLSKLNVLRISRRIDFGVE